VPSVVTKWFYVVTSASQSQESNYFQKNGGRAHVEWTHGRTKSIHRPNTLELETPVWDACLHGLQLQHNRSVALFAALCFWNELLLPLVCHILTRVFRATCLVVRGYCRSMLLRDAPLIRPCMMRHSTRTPLILICIVFLFPTIFTGSRLSCNIIGVQLRNNIETTTLLLGRSQGSRAIVIRFWISIISKKIVERKKRMDW
jgi:hypothetical protein